MINAISLSALYLPCRPCRGDRRRDPLVCHMRLSIGRPPLSFFILSPSFHSCLSGLPFSPSLPLRRLRIPWPLVSLSLSLHANLHAFSSLLTSAPIPSPPMSWAGAHQQSEHACVTVPGTSENSGSSCAHQGGGGVSLLWEKAWSVAATVPTQTSCLVCHHQFTITYIIITSHSLYHTITTNVGGCALSNTVDTYVS